MTIDVEKMLRSGVEMDQIMEAFAKEAAAVQEKLDAEKAEAEANESTKVGAMNKYLEGYTEYLRACGVKADPRLVENEKECLEMEVEMIKKHNAGQLTLASLFHHFG